MSEKLPYMQFFPGDWLLDCQCLSLASRGAWMTMLCHMWRSDRRGEWSGTWGALARTLGCGEDEAKTFVDEVTACNVAVTVSGNASVTLSCRRMMREEKAREATRCRVRRHRDTAEKRDGNASGNASGNGSVTVQKSEVRSQKSETESSSELSVGASEPAEPPVREVDPAAEAKPAEIDSPVRAVPEIPPDVLAQARSVFGLTPEATLLDWLGRREYPPDWLRSAIPKAEARGVRDGRAIRYVEAILCSWKANGGPEKEQAHATSRRAREPRPDHGQSAGAAKYAGHPAA